MPLSLRPGSPFFPSMSVAAMVEPAMTLLGICFAAEAVAWFSAPAAWLIHLVVCCTLVMHLLKKDRDPMTWAVIAVGMALQLLPVAPGWWPFLVALAVAHGAIVGVPKLCMSLWFLAALFAGWIPAVAHTFVYIATAVHTK